MWMCAYIVFVCVCQSVRRASSSTCRAASTALSATSRCMRPTPSFTCELTEHCRTSCTSWYPTCWKVSCVSEWFFHVLHSSWFDSGVEGEPVSNFVNLDPPSPPTSYPLLSLLVKQSITWLNATTRSLIKMLNSHAFSSWKWLHTVFMCCWFCNRLLERDFTEVGFTSPDFTEVILNYVFFVEIPLILFGCLLLICPLLCFFLPSVVVYLSSLTWRRLSVESTWLFLWLFVIHWRVQFPSSFPNFFLQKLV